MKRFYVENPKLDHHDAVRYCIFPKGTNTSVELTLEEAFDENQPEDVHIYHYTKMKEPKKVYCKNCCYVKHDTQECLHPNNIGNVTIDDYYEYKIHKIPSKIRYANANNNCRLFKELGKDVCDPVGSKDDGVPKFGTIDAWEVREGGPYSGDRFTIDVSRTEKNIFGEDINVIITKWKYPLWKRIIYRIIGEPNQN